MGSKSTTTVTPAPATATELALQRQQLQLGQLQLDAIIQGQETTASFNEFFLGEEGLLSQIGELFGLQAGQAISEAQFRETLQPLEFENLQRTAELQGITIEQAREQAGLQGDLNDFIRGQIADEEAGILSPERQVALDLSRQQLESAQAFGPVRDELSAQLLSQLQNFGQVDPEREALIRELSGNIISQGQASLEGERERALRQLRNELAPQLGLRSTDTPIIDRGGFVVEESLRQAGSLERGVRAAELQQLLNEPFAALGAIGGLALGGQQVQTQGLAVAGQGATNLAALDLQALGQAGQLGLGGGQLGLANQALQFDLAGRASQNRLALTSQLGSFNQQGLSQGLGLIQSFNPNTVGALGQQLQFRLGTATTTQRESGLGSALGSIGSLAGGLGGLLTGAAAVSDRNLKENFEDVAPVLKKLRGIKVEGWNYKGDRQKHIGPMAADFAAAFGGSNREIDIITYLGVLLKANQELAVKIELLEAR